MIRVAVALALFAIPARADTDLGNEYVVFARGNALLKSDAKGKSETQIATLPAKATVRALRTDAAGKVLLADINGTWSWLPLDGSSKTLTELPCDPGPAQIAEDALCVLCRSKKGDGGAIIVNLATGKQTPAAVPPATRIAGTGADRKLIWADGDGVWTASPASPKKKQQAVKEPPLRGFLPSPDGTHALGVYKSEVFEGNRGKATKPAEILMVFGLDGNGARRKVIKSGLPIEWSHDSQWVLVQDKNGACIMMAHGGQYKCWRGYTAASISPDGKYALVLGTRDKKADKPSKKSKKKRAKKAPAEEPSEMPEDDEHGDEEIPSDDVALAPPTGPLSLYRAQLEGAYTSSPAVVAKVVEGAAVWIPSKP